MQTEKIKKEGRTKGKKLQGFEISSGVHYAKNNTIKAVCLTNHCKHIWTQLNVLIYEWVDYIFSKYLLNNQAEVIRCWCFNDIKRRESCKASHNEYMINIVIHQLIKITMRGKEAEPETTSY